MYGGVTLIYESFKEGWVIVSWFLGVCVFFFNILLVKSVAWTIIFSSNDLAFYYHFIYFEFDIVLWVYWNRSALVGSVRSLLYFYVVFKIL